MASRSAGHLAAAVLAGTVLAGAFGLAMAAGSLPATAASATGPALAAIDSAATPNTVPSANRPPLPGENLTPAPDSPAGTGKDDGGTGDESAPEATPADSGKPPAPEAATPSKSAPSPDAAPTAGSNPQDDGRQDSGPAAPAGDTSSGAERPATPADGKAAPAPATAAPDAEPATDEEADNRPLPPIHYGVEGLPEPVRKTRQAILDAARTGDIEKLRAVIQASQPAPKLSKRPYGDPIAFLKENSGDEAGREILAILLDLLESGWVVTDPGTPNETYLWPYFAVYPIGRLTPAQQVEVLRVLTASDVDEMTAYDAYLFFKIGIAPDGTWRFFIADDGDD